LLGTIRESKSPAACKRGGRLIQALILPLLLLGAVLPCFAKGKQEETAPEALNKEWVLCVTNIDVSAMPDSRRAIANVLSNNLVDRLNEIRRRIRVSPEYTYYESTAWLNALSEAGKQIAAKRDQRDLLLFSGDPKWKYRRDLKALDKEIAVLEETYAEAEANLPLIEEKPTFRLTDENIAGNFPAPPLEGAELLFCRNQRIDAFMTGKIIEYHGRIYLALRFYTLYTRSYTYEDSIIFSPEDLDAAADELSDRLVSVMEGGPQAAITIRAMPKDAIITIGEGFGGRGETPVLEYPPDKMEISVSAPDHQSYTFNYDLTGGELADFTISLTPLGTTLFQVDTPNHAESLVFQDSLFVGKTPLVLPLPRSSYQYLTVETEDGQVGSTVIPSDAQGEMIELPMTVHDPLEKGRVEKVRRQFYGAWGRFWIVIPVTMMINGLANSVTTAYTRNLDPSNDQYDLASKYYWASIGINVITAAVVVESVIRIVVYLYGSTKGEPKINRAKVRGK
jgi:hypothetical protein